jgi:hypothetical protein
MPTRLRFRRLSRNLEVEALQQKEVEKTNSGEEAEVVVKTRSGTILHSTSQEGEAGQKITSLQTISSPKT